MTGPEMQVGELLADVVLPAFPVTSVGRVAAQLGDALAYQVDEDAPAELARVAVVVEVNGELFAMSWRPAGGLDESAGPMRTAVVVLGSAVGELDAADAMLELAREHVERARGGGGPLGGDPANEEGRTAGGGCLAPCTGSSSRSRPSEDPPPTSEWPPIHLPLQPGQVHGLAQPLDLPKCVTCGGSILRPGGDCPSHDPRTSAIIQTACEELAVDVRRVLDARGR